MDVQMAACYTHYRTMFECIDQTLDQYLEVLEMQLQGFILPCGSNMWRDCMPSIHSWKRNGLCSMKWAYLWEHTIHVVITFSERN